MYPDFYEVAAGYDNSASMVQKFGYNAAVDGACDVWEADGAYTGFLSEAGTLDVVSADEDDATGDTGARTLRLIGLDASGERLTEDVTLTGLTPVTTTGEFLRMQRAYVLTAGSTGTNEGIITIDTTVGDTKVATIGAGMGQTLIACYTVPASTAGDIIRWYADISKAAGAAANVVVALQTRDDGGAWRTREIHSLQNGQSVLKDIVIEVGPLTDIRVSVLSASSATLVSAGFDVVEMNAIG